MFGKEHLRSIVRKKYQNKEIHEPSCFADLLLQQRQKVLAGPQTTSRKENQNLCSGKWSKYWDWQTMGANDGIKKWKKIKK